MPPRARQAKPQETAADTSPTQAPEETAPPVETPEDQAAPAETADAGAADPTPPDDPEETAPPEDAEDDDAAAAPPDPYTQALLRERAGYVRYDRKDRLADVDAELERLGVKPPRD